MSIIEEFESNGIECNLGASNWHVDHGTAAIYPPATDEMIEWACLEAKAEFPPALVSLLKSTNGCFFKKLTLFGIPVSLFEGKGLSRGLLQPQSITTANRAWRVNYKAPNEAVMVGSIQGWSGNTGLFMLPSGQCVKINSSGISEPFQLTEKWRALAENA